MTDRHRILADKCLALAHRTPGFIAFFDGCCEPRNPGGTAGFGAAILNRGELIWQHSGMIPAAPTTSNNIAEYRAVSAVFDYFAESDPKATVRIFGDSRLVICQLWGWPEIGKRKWRIAGVDGPGQRGYYSEVAVATREKLKLLPNCKGYWIPREHNSLADDLSKAELRRVGVKFRIQPEA